MNDNFSPEEIIFNPLIYGSATFKKNTFDSDANINGENTTIDSINFQVETIFNSNLKINNDVILSQNSKIILDDTNIQTIDIKNILKIDNIENTLTDYIEKNNLKINNLSDKLNEFVTTNDQKINNLSNYINEYVDTNDLKINNLSNDFLEYTEMNNLKVDNLSKNFTDYINSNVLKIKDLSENVEEYKKNNNLKIDNLSDNLEKYKTKTDFEINNLKNGYKKIININENIELTDVVYDIFIITNGYDFKLPIIKNEMIGKTFTIVNIDNNTSKIIAGSNNIFENSKKNLFLLRNYKSINIVCINLTSWLII